MAADRARALRRRRPAFQLEYQEYYPWLSQNKNNSRRSSRPCTRQLLEETFDISIDPDDLTPDNFGTVNSIVAYLDR